MKGEEDNFKTKLQKLLSQSNEDVTTISDIEDRYFNMEQLNVKELKALNNYEYYRVRKLKEAKSNRKFNRNFLRLKVLSNVADYTEFLKPRYDH